MDRYHEVRNSRSGNSIDICLTGTTVGGVAIHSGTIWDNEHDVGSDVIRVRRTAAMGRHHVSFVHVRETNPVHVNRSMRYGVLKERKEGLISAYRLVLW